MVRRALHRLETGNTVAFNPAEVAVKQGKGHIVYFVIWQLEPLEQMVATTVRLFECDRDEMYSYVLRAYSRWSFTLKIQICH